MYVFSTIHTFLYQSPNSVVDQVSGSTGLFSGHKIWRDKIRYFLLRELNCFMSVE